jgi:hypothetical protein
MTDASEAKGNTCHREERRDMAISWRTLPFATGLLRHIISRNDKKNAVTSPGFDDE